MYIKNTEIVDQATGCPIHMRNGQLYITTHSGVVRRYAGDVKEYLALLSLLPPVLKITPPQRDMKIYEECVSNARAVNRLLVACKKRKLLVSRAVADHSVNTFRRYRELHMLAARFYKNNARDL